MRGGLRRSFCMECGYDHTPERRRAIIRRMGRDATPQDILDAYGDHLFGSLRSVEREMRAVWGSRDGDRHTGAPARLAAALRLVGSAGIVQACRAAKADPARVRAALKAKGYTFKRRSVGTGTATHAVGEWLKTAA